MPLVLVVDDVAALADQYAYDLKRVGGYDTRVATGGREALDAIDDDVIDCVILDLEMPGVDGFEVLRTLKKRGLQIPVIVYTGTGNYDRCVKAVRLGAYGFIDKTEPMERVAQEIENALARVQLELEVESLRKTLGAETPLIGSSEAMRVLKQQIERLAPIPSAVLITGESGTGKELVARELHRAGTDDGKPFIAVNSAALPENLIESELFGHERGAFTGANRTRRGAFELASGGTLFLDEIGELPLAAQAKLLRVLEHDEVTRLGGERPIRVSARVVAATNRDLDVETRSGRFRPDLFHRLAVHTIHVPPLRERLSDIREFADHFITETCIRFGVRRKTMEPEALSALMGYDWAQNNVRELRNIIERMIIASDTTTIRLDHVPDPIRAGERFRAPEGTGSLKSLKAEAERRIIISALERNHWHITRTAESLGLADHASLLKIMRRHHIQKP